MSNQPIKPYKIELWRQRPLRPGRTLTGNQRIDRSMLVALLCRGGDILFEKAMQQVRFTVEARDLSGKKPIIVSFDFTYPEE
jgi:hypothetical protein